MRKKPMGALKAYQSDEDDTEDAYNTFSCDMIR
jgi:hypothetical protein